MRYAIEHLEFALKFAELYQDQELIEIINQALDRCRFQNQEQLMI